ncbi:MAG: hypothetical protein JWO22_3205 [Frankiales bacterium]|nr:hypothetical protein [Frankiales bacterium]
MTDADSPAEVASELGKDVGKAALRVGRRFAVKVRSAAEADGAGRSGLAALLTTHALSSAGDAMVAVALATNTFFSVNAGAARGRVALYLVLTLLPFALLIPVAAPLLDRFPHGRRNVIAITAAGRGLLCWTVAGSLASLGFYPQAMGILVLQRAYSVARAAAVVRVRPPALGLVAANARMNVASLASSGLAAGLGAALSSAFSAAVDLRVAAVVFLAAGFMALRLPSRIDDAPAPRPEVRTTFDMSDAPIVIRRPLVVTVSMRASVGLLTLGLAILLKAHKASVLQAGVILGAGVVGGLIGTALASRFSAERVARITAMALLAPLAACALAAVFGGTLFYAIAVGSVGLGASLGKYALDAALQTHADATQVGSAFAKSETFLQLGWAAGGALGLLLSFADGIGYGIALHLVFAVVTALPLAGLVYARRHQAPPRRVASARADIAERRPGGR